MRTKKYKTLSGIIRAYEDRLSYEESDARRAGRPFDWTAHATPLAENILRQLMNTDIPPDKSLADWINTLITDTPTCAGDLKKIARFLHGPRIRVLSTTVTHVESGRSGD